MVRKITEIDQPSSLRIQAAFNDTYLRPSQETQKGSLAQIEASLQGWAPALARKIEEKQKIKDNFQEAQGMELARKSIAAGDTRTIQEILQNQKDGVATDYKQKTKAFMQGAYKQRHENIGYAAKQHMLQYGATATIKDQNGKEIPISQADDQELVINSILAEAERYVTEQAGGKYDPVYYNQYIKPNIDQAIEQIIGLQAKNRIEQTQQNIIKDTTGILDSTLVPYINGGALLAGGAEAQNHIALSLAKQADTMMSLGFSELQTASYLSSYIQNLMKTTAYKDRDNADKILQAVQQIPIFQDPKILETLQDGAKAAKDAAFWDKQQKDEIEQDRLIQEAFDIYKDYRTTKNPAKLNAFKNSDYKSLASANKVKQALDEAAESTNEMDSDEYYSLATDARKGKLNRGQAYLLFPKMSLKQQDYLDSIIDDRESDIKRLTSGGITNAQAQAQLNKDITMAEKQLGYYLKDTDYTDTQDPKKTANYLAVKTMLVDQIYEQAQEEINKNPNMPNKTKEYIYARIAGKIMQENKGLIDTFVSDPQLVQEPDKNKVRKTQSTNILKDLNTKLINKNIKVNLNQILGTGDKKTLAKIIKKATNGVGNPESLADYYLAQYAIVTGSDK